MTAYAPLNVLFDPKTRTATLIYQGKTTEVVWPEGQSDEEFMMVLHAEAEKVYGVKIPLPQRAKLG